MPRKVFVAGEILTAADVNTNLMDQSVMVFDDASARTTAIPTPVEGMVTYLKDTDEVDKFDGSAFVPVGIAPAILQVLSTTKNDAFTSTTVAFTDITGLAVTITPSSTSSKILVIASVNFSSNSDAMIDLVRDSTPIGNGTGGGTANGFGQVVGATSASQLGFTANHLDSPASTSALTYKVRARPITPGSVSVNRRHSDAAYATSSHITVMEIAG